MLEMLNQSINGASWIGSVRAIDAVRRDSHTGLTT